MKHRLLLGSLASLLTAGCALQDPPAGAGIMPESARNKIPGTWARSHRSGEVVPNWIRTFHDPQLTALVADAVERNPDLRAAAARVEASRHAIRVAASSLYPRIAMKGLGERQGREITSSRGGQIDPPDLGGLGVDLSGGAPDTSNLDTSTQRWVYGLGVGASWELDLWARVRSKKAAAKAESAALEADYEYARQSLAAAVARAYFSVIEAAQQEANAQETLSLYEDYSKLTDERKQQGHASEFDVAQIRSRTAGAKDTYFSAQAARAQAIRAIEVVTSNYPAGKLHIRRSFPAQPKAVPAGIPAQILERRPDLRAAEQRVGAAFHRTAEARAARLPRFSLSASAGMGSAQLDTVGVMEAVNWSLAAGVIQPIFFGGELKAVQDIRTAEQKAATASYVGVALRAFENVEDALASDYYLRQREGALHEMVGASAESLKLGRGRLSEGQEDMFAILRLAGENLAAKIELTKIRASRLRERVNLHLALGGDFQGSGSPGK
jgi:multidrug efflux system outer membrane protein